MNVTEIDNRDQGTTWLWVNDNPEYTPHLVEIDPGELYGNMIENCYNEDVLFLFDRFQTYLEVLDARQGAGEILPIKSDVSTDHIEGFRDFLTDMIDDNRIERERALKRAQEDTQ